MTPHARLLPAVGYLVICGIVPVLYVWNTFPNGRLYVQLYSHFLLYPLYFGWLAVFLVTGAWQFIRDQMARRQRLVLFAGIAAFAIIAMLIDMSSENIAPFRLKISVITEIPELNDHFLDTASDSAKKTYEELANREIRRSAWTAPNTIFYTSFYVQAYTLGFIIATISILATHRSRPNFRDTREFQRALASSAAAFLIYFLWLLMRIAFRQQKQEFFIAESLPAADFVIAVGYIIGAVLIAMCFWLWLGDKLVAALTLFFGGISALTAWKQPMILVHIFGRDAGQWSYLSILLGIAFFGFLYWFAHGTPQKN